MYLSKHQNVLSQIITHVDAVTGCVKYYTPRGRFVHVPPTCPHTDWPSDFGKPWWKDMCYEVGILTAKARWIRIINTLTAQEQRLEVKSSCTQCYEFWLAIILWLNFLFLPNKIMICQAGFTDQFKEICALKSLITVCTQNACLLMQKCYMNL